MVYSECNVVGNSGFSGQTRARDATSGIDLIMMRGNWLKK